MNHRSVKSRSVQPRVGVSPIVGCAPCKCGDSKARQIELFLSLCGGRSGCSRVFSVTLTLMCFLRSLARR